MSAEMNGTAHQTDGESMEVDDTVVPVKPAVAPGNSEVTTNLDDVDMKSTDDGNDADAGSGHDEVDAVRSPEVSNGDGAVSELTVTSAAPTDARESTPSNRSTVSAASSDSSDDIVTVEERLRSRPHLTATPVSSPHSGSMTVRTVSTSISTVTSSQSLLSHQQQQHQSSSSQLQNQRSAAPLSISGSVLTALAQYGISTSGMTADQLQQLHEYYRRSQNDREFILEAPSFIVPYVRECPASMSAQQLVKSLEKESGNKKNDGDVEDSQEKSSSEENDKKECEAGSVAGEADKENKPSDSADTATSSEQDKRSEDFAHLGKWAYYYQGVVGQFVHEQGRNIVEEFIKEDLLKQQKRKAAREKSGGSEATRFAIKSLTANLATSREKNAPFHLKKSQCRYCAFESESMLAMERHLEIPHMVGSIFQCNFCDFESRSHQTMLSHMTADHEVEGRLERAPATFQCPLCPYEDSGKARMARHINGCQKKFRAERNQALDDWTPPAKVARVHRGRPNVLGKQFEPVRMPMTAGAAAGMQPMNAAAVRARGRPIGSYKEGVGGAISTNNYYNRPGSGARANVPGAAYPGSHMIRQPSPMHYQIGNQVYQLVNNQLVPVSGNSSGRSSSSVQISASSQHNTATALPPGISIQPSSGKCGVGSSSSSSAAAAAAALKLSSSPSISITPVSRPSLTAANTPSILRGSGGQVSISKVSGGGGGGGALNLSANRHNAAQNKGAFVICEICDGYIKDLEQLRNHMQWVHKVKIHPKMIYNRPPLNCQKCQLRFFTDQGLERHLLGSHGLVTSSMQEAANRGQDGGRCPVCGKVFHLKLLHHVAKEHRVVLKPAHLSYKCTVCSATFGMYKQFENHVYSTHSIVAKKIMESSDRRFKSSPSAGGQQAGQQAQQTGGAAAASSTIRINDEITIIPHPSKPTASSAGNSRGDGNAKSSSQQQNQSGVKNSSSSAAAGQLSCQLCDFSTDKADSLTTHYDSVHLGQVSVEFTPLLHDNQVTDQISEEVRKQLGSARADTVEVELSDDDDNEDDQSAGPRVITVKRPRARVGPRSAHRRWRARLAPKSVLLARASKSAGGQ